ncbi:hypothetical protein SAMN05444141_107348 [Pseudovibrio denitrificans]|uniref:Uncharacterized protein n=1 Tax=Pseudovibrio denitrificans TaxID=258256 RepID=A0A1I7D618_9HYPH|nr:hypothetical protein SAMN05444141_107348 [Pseudovibrio denitrificans]
MIKLCMLQGMDRRLSLVGEMERTHLISEDYRILFYEFTCRDDQSMPLWTGHRRKRLCEIVYELRRSL